MYRSICVDILGKGYLCPSNNTNFVYKYFERGNEYDEYKNLKNGVTKAQVFAGSMRESVAKLMKEYETYTKQIDAGVEPKDAGGLSVTDLRKELFKLYASHSKRTR